MFTLRAKIIPMSYAASLVDCLEQRNLKCNELLCMVQITPAQLRKADEYLSYNQLKTLIERAIDLTQEPEFGLNFGQQLNFTSHGELGYAALSCQTLEESIGLLLKYFKIRAPNIRFDMVRPTAQYAINLSTTLIQNPVKRFIIDAVFSSFHRMRRFILQQDNLNTEVRFCFSAPENIAHYQAIFGENLHFNCKCNQYIASADELKTVPPLADSIAKEIAIQKCQALLIKLGGQEDLISCVQKILLKDPACFPNLEETAQQLYLSSRTLKRRLQELDTSFQRIIDELRQKMAVDYLESTSLSVTEIAYALHFNDTSNFSKAFKQWLSISPSDYRKKYQDMNLINMAQ